jgi:hypothetical protein
MTDFFKRNSLWFLLLLIALAIYFLPIKIPSDIHTMGKVYSPKQYILHTGNDGQVRESLINVATGIHEQFSARELERGDDIRLKIQPKIFKKDIIKKGDTLAYISSYATTLNLNSLNNDLEILRAQLAVEQSGLKPEDIELAEKRYEYARIDAEIQDKIYQRQKNLHDSDVIADQEYEDQQRMAQLKKMQVAINEAELKSMESGSKPEQLNYIRAQMNKLNGEIANLNMKISNQTITSPLNGIFRNSYSPDTLMVIEDIDDLILKAPVQVAEMDNVFKGQKITCKVDGRKEVFEAEVVNISKNVTVLNARQIVIITCRFSEDDPGIYPGIVVRAKLERESVLLRDFLVDRFEIFFGQ